MKNKKGFTMMELVVTMIIVITLSLISWPIYRGRHREYSTLAEGYALLGAIKEAQIAYYNEYGNFLSSYCSYNNTQLANVYTANDPVLRINAMNNRYFSWFKYDYSYHNEWKWTSKLDIIVQSKNYGTVRWIYDLKERHEPEVINAKPVIIN